MYACVCVSLSFFYSQNSKIARRRFARKYWNLVEIHVHAFFHFASFSFHLIMKYHSFVVINNRSGSYFFFLCFLNAFSLSVYRCLLLDKNVLHHMIMCTVSSSSHFPFLLYRRTAQLKHLPFDELLHWYKIHSLLAHASTRVARPYTNTATFNANRCRRCCRHHRAHHPPLRNKTIVLMIILLVPLVEF